MYLLELLKLIPVTIIGGIAALALTAGIAFYSNPGGEIAVGGLIESQGLVFQPIELTNYNNTAIKGVEMIFRGRLTRAEISSSLPVEIETKDIPKDGIDFTKITIVSLYERSSIRLLVKIPSRAESQMYATNAKELGIGFVHDAPKKSRGTRAVEEALTSVLVFSVGFLLVFPIFILHETKVDRQPLVA